MVLNSPISKSDFLGLSSFLFGAGRICVSRFCKDKSEYSFVRYVAEEEPIDPATGNEGAKRLRTLPDPGQCVDADEIYSVGAAWKINDAGDVEVQCSCYTHKFSTISFSGGPVAAYTKWAWGDPMPARPAGWPGSIPPNRNEPPLGADDPPLNPD